MNEQNYTSGTKSYICGICKKKFRDYVSKKRQFCSSKCSNEAHANNRKLRGGGYSSIHKWLKRRYGKAFRCEDPRCNGITNLYEWALIKGKNYRHKRENFIMLCKSCHRKYDMTEEIKGKISRTKIRNNLQFNTNP